MVRLAIVGLGRWGKRLVDSVQDHSPHVRFTTAVGRDTQRIAADAASRDLTVYSDLASALKDGNVEGVVLATPHSRHAEQVKLCAAAGHPVLVEKPFALTRSSAVSALTAAAKAGVLVCAAHNRRFLEPIVALERLIKAGDLGTVLHIETNFSSNAMGRWTTDSWRVAPGESPAGGLAGSGIHHIDTIIDLDGEIASVQAILTRRVHDVPLDDTTAILFRLRSGATASLLTITATAPLYRIVVYGTAGRAKINGDAFERGSENLILTKLDGGSTMYSFPPTDIERAELEAFAAAIRGQKPYPVTSSEVENGIAALEAVSLSAERGASVSI